MRGPGPKDQMGSGLSQQTHLQDGFEAAEGLSRGKDLADGSLWQGMSMRAPEERGRLLQPQGGRSSVPAPPRTARPRSLSSVGLTRWGGGEGTGLPWGPRGALVGAATAGW